MKHKHGSGGDDGDEASLFREAVRGVRKLVTDRHTPAPPRKSAPRARFTRAGLRDAVVEDATPFIDAGEALEEAFRRPGIQETVLRKLRRGRYGLQGEIDLHGLRVDDARRALREFLADSLALNARCVRIVHGKGMRSGTRGPVVKAAVAHILRACNSVMAYVPARPEDGGSGATYVLLSRD